VRTSPITGSTGATAEVATHDCCRTLVAHLHGRRGHHVTDNTTALHRDVALARSLLLLLSRDGRAGRLALAPCGHQLVDRLLITGQAGRNHRAK